MNDNLTKSFEDGLSAVTELRILKAMSEVKADMQEFKDSVNKTLSCVVTKEDMKQALGDHAFKCPFSETYMKKADFDSWWDVAYEKNKSKQMESFNQKTVFAKNIKEWIIFIVIIGSALSFMAKNVSDTQSENKSREVKNNTVNELGDFKELKQRMLEITKVMEDSLYKSK